MWELIKKFFIWFYTNDDNDFIEYPYDEYRYFD